MMLTRAEFQRASLDFQRTSLELQNKIEKQFSEIMAALNRSRDDELCDDRSPLDRYSPSSQKVKGSRFDHFERSGVDRRFGGGQFHEGDRQTYGSSAELLDLRFRDYLMLRNDDDDETWTWTETDQAFDDEDLVETEIATELIGIEDETVKREANAEVISAIKKEQIPQIQVPISKLEHGLQIHNASPTVCEDSQYVVGCDELCEHQGSKLQVSHVKERNVLVTESTSVTINQVAHQLFDKMSFRVQSKRRQIKCHKSWRFKFKQRKQQRSQLRPAHKLIHRWNVMEDDQVSHETLPLWLLIRSKFRKFKFRNKNFQKMMREHGHFSHLKLKSDMGEDDEMLEVARGVSKRSMLCLTFRIRESNAGEEQQTVYEQLKMVNEWQHQISLVLQQVMRSKKIRLSKRWWFKYRFDEEDQGSLQSRAGHSLSRREILTFISQAKAWWIQEVIAVTGFLLRRHLHLNLNCEEPKLAGQKRNHGLLIRLHSKQKQRKCPKSWMFKFKMDSEPAGTRYLKSHKECGICAQVRGAKKQSKLLLLSLCPSFIRRAMLRVTVKQRKHSKTWSFKYKQQGNFRLLRCVGEGTRKDIVTVTSCRSYGLGKKFLLLNLEVKVSSKEGDVLQENGHGLGSRPIFSFDGP